MSVQSEGRAGAFATSRRGGMTPAEISTVHDLKGKGRGTQFIATYLGRPMEDVARLFSPEPAKPAVKAAPPAPVVILGTQGPRGGRPSRTLTADDIKNLQLCRAGKISQRRCGQMMKASITTVRLALNRISDEVSA